VFGRRRMAVVCIVVAGAQFDVCRAKGLPTSIRLGRLPLNGELKSRGTPCPSFVLALCACVPACPSQDAFTRYPRPGLQLPLQIAVANGNLCSQLSFPTKAQRRSSGQNSSSRVKELHNGALDDDFSSSISSNVDGAVLLRITLNSLHSLGFVNPGSTDLLSS
jgi:hypothetical protein